MLWTSTLQEGCLRAIARSVGPMPVYARATSRSSIVGIVGTARIGTCFARIRAGARYRVLATAPNLDLDGETLGARCVELPELLRTSDIMQPAWPVDASDPASDRRRCAVPDQAACDADQHQPRRRGRPTWLDPRLEVRVPWQPGVGRLPGRRRSVLPRTVRRGPPRRRVRAPARPSPSRRNGPPVLFHRGRDEGDCTVRHRLPRHLRGRGGRTARRVRRAPRPRGRTW